MKPKTFGHCNRERLLLIGVNGSLLTNAAVGNNWQTIVSQAGIVTDSCQWALRW